MIDALQKGNAAAAALEKGLEGATIVELNGWPIFAAGVGQKIPWGIIAACLQLLPSSDAGTLQ